MNAKQLSRSATYLDLERLRLFGDLDLDLERPRDLLRGLRLRLDERRRRERDRLRLRLERLDERDLPPRPDLHEKCTDH